MSLIKIEVITAEKKLEGLKKEIAKLGITGMTVMEVQGCGVQKGTPEYVEELYKDIALLPKQMIIMVVEKEILDKALEAIKKELYTGHIGDGKIFISEVSNIIRIRTGEEGTDALK